MVQITPTCWKYCETRLMHVATVILDELVNSEGLNNLDRKMVKRLS